MKEIKKGLECCTIKGKKCEDCQFVDKHPFACVKELLCQSLTLINELESENERLTEERDLYKKQFNELESRFFDLREENYELKDRIAELEKENAVTTDTITDLFNKQEFYEKEKLKQFAERLKKEIKAKVKWYADHADKCYNGITENDIDETLKEFLK